MLIYCITLFFNSVKSKVYLFFNIHTSCLLQQFSHISENCSFRYIFSRLRNHYDTKAVYDLLILCSLSVSSVFLTKTLHAKLKTTMSYN